MYRYYAARIQFIRDIGSFYGLPFRMVPEIQKKNIGRASGDKIARMYKTEGR